MRTEYSIQGEHVQHFSLRNPWGWFYAFSFSAVVWALVFGTCVSLSHAHTAVETPAVSVATN